MGNKPKSQEYRAEQRANRARHAVWEMELLESLKGLHKPLSGEERYYTQDDSFVPTPSTTLFGEIENVLREKPLGTGKTSKAYTLHGNFEGYVLNIDRKEMDLRLSESTMLYPVKITAKNVGAPILMNESGSIQIQPLMPGKSAQKTYEEMRDHYRLEYAHYKSAPYYASTRAHSDYLKSLIAIPDEIYTEYFKSIVLAAKDGLPPDLHSNNVFLEKLPDKTHIRALDFHHYNSEKFGPRIRLPGTLSIINGFALEDDPYRMVTPQIETLYRTLKDKIEHALTVANHDPEIRSVLGDQPISDGLVAPKLLPGNWLDKEHGRAMKDITEITR